MKLLYETPDEQAGHVEEQAAPTETGGPTLSEALAAMDPSLTVEPVGEADEVVVEEEAELSEAEAPGDEMVEGTDDSPVDSETDLEVEAEATAEADLEAEDEGEPPEEVEGIFTLTVGEVELDLDVEDADTRAALENMQNDLERVSDIDNMVDRAQELGTKNQQDALALQQIEDELRLDPAGYITDRVHETVQIEVARALLLDDTVLQAVEDTLTEWIEDPSKRKVDAAERKGKRIEQREYFRTQRDRMRSDQANAKAVFNKIMEITPDDMDHATAKMWHSDAISEIQQHVRDKKIETLDPDQIPRILASRMRLYGIGDTARVVRAQPTDDRGKQLAKDLEDAKKMPERVRRRVASRKKVATTPSGVGGAAGRTQVNKGATLDEVLKDLKQRVRQ